MDISKVGIALIQQWESCRLDSYRDIGGVWTVGWGTTEGAEPDQHITQDEADQMLSRDVDRVSNVLSCSITQAVSQNQFDACCSLAYNIGTGNFNSSTLLKLLNSGDIQGASQQFPRWDKSGGQQVQGLLNRRLAEQDLFLQTDTPPWE